jgi:4-aminobutyrate aminotransferase-like enzyme/Ser/Thr protein kinase RdoA (MazF antagonist)
MNYEALDISPGDIAELARIHYDLRGRILKLPGEVDFNYLIESKNRKYTLKVTRPQTSQEYLEFQYAILKHLVASDFPRQIPEIIPSTDGRDYITLDNQRYLRLQKWVPGQMVAEIKPRLPGLLHSWGRTAGLFSLHLRDFDHPGAHRLQKWNPSEVLRAREYRPWFQYEDEVAIADYFWDLFERRVLPVLSTLRKSVNYNDAHEHNLLVEGDLQKPEITGIIDFGDALYTETINELAIACAYACMQMPDPLGAACEVVRGYHEVFPLNEEELQVLFTLISARLLLTVANAAWNKHIEPENKYLQVSEKPAWDLLWKWKEIPPSLALYRFRSVCGLEPCSRRIYFDQWLSTNQDDLFPVVDLSQQKVVSLDLSVGSLDLGNNTDFESIAPFEKTVNRMLEDQQARIGIGGYGEVRPFYSTSAFRAKGNLGARWRTVHLGLDCWSPAGTPVFAPLDAVVHSFQENAGDGNYGPTIILQHELPGDGSFYTLYGHLSRESLDVLTAGSKVTRGTRIATIGSPPVNGNWPPHLHFQVILDLLEAEGDFPGVAYPEEADTWLSICPEPRLFFGFVPGSEAGMSDQQLLVSRHQNLGTSLSISYLKPLHMVRGFGQWLYDSSGRRYLDTVNNVAHVGHQHPAVVRSAQRQVAVLNTNTRYLHENLVLFAEELLATFPPELCVVHFVNSGSEANELALRMVETFTGQKDMIAVEVGYHGNTTGCIAVSSYKFDGKGGKGAPATTQVVPIPDVYRGLYRDSDAGHRYAGHIKRVIGNINASGRKVGGYISESILSCGGQIVLPQHYLQEAYAFVRAAGGLCIADEVQVGFGRVGSHFWGFQLQGVIPDIVTMGKPMGNGHPLGAVVTTREVADAFANGMEYFNTFGGNPVSCAVGREVLRIVREEGLQEHARQTGQYLTSRLSALQQRFPLIGDVRGPGLFMGIELVRNRDTLEPATREAAYLINRMRDRGILMSTDGPFNNVLKIKPPMCFDEHDADFLLENLEEVLGDSYLKIAD